MKNIKILIKLKKQELDNNRRILVELQENSNILQGKIIHIDKELEYEQNIVKELGGFSPIYHQYYINNRKKKEIIIFDIKKCEIEIEKISEIIAQDFAELKKYEIILDDMIKSEKEKIMLKEQENLDEITINNFYKNQE